MRGKKIPQQINKIILSLRYRYGLHKDIGKPAYTIISVNEKKERKIIVPKADNWSKLKKNIEHLFLIEDPSGIIIEYFKDKGDTNPEDIQIYKRDDDEIYETNTNLGRIEEKQNEGKGLGEIINEKVNEKMEEYKKQKEKERIENELKEAKELVKELESDLEETEEKLEGYEKIINQVSLNLGGELFKKFFPNSNINLSGLLPTGNTNNQLPANDSSGIEEIDDNLSEEQQKSKEAIDGISAFLYTLDIASLHKMNNIMYFINQDQSNIDKVFNFLEQNNIN